MLAVPYMTRVCSLCLGALCACWAFALYQRIYIPNSQNFHDLGLNHFFCLISNQKFSLNFVKCVGLVQLRLPNYETMTVESITLDTFFLFNSELPNGGL